MMIKSLIEFIQKIKQLPTCPKGYQRFYRGQNIEKSMCPAVFRSKSFIENESNIFYEIINKKPDEFEKCKCTFDYLVKMQHYRIPTRLLDITSNPLIALCFALLEEGEKPTVYCIDVPNKLVKNYMSDNVAILSALAKSTYSTKKEIEDRTKIKLCFRDSFIQNSLKHREAINSFLEYKYFKKGSPIDEEPYLKKLAAKMVSVNGELVTVSESFIKINKTPTCMINYYIRLLEKIIDRVPDAESSESFKEALIKITYRIDELSSITDNTLLHEIKQDKPYFNDYMRVDTFNTVFCVKPKLDNPRIIKQNGAFLLFPNPDIQLDENNEHKMNIRKLPVSPTKRDTILSSLEQIDISRETLYNDMDTVSQAIKDKYR